MISNGWQGTPSKEEGITRDRSGLAAAFQVKILLVLLLTEISSNLLLARSIALDTYRLAIKMGIFFPSLRLWSIYIKRGFEYFTQWAITKWQYSLAPSSVIPLDMLLSEIYCCRAKDKWLILCKKELKGTEYNFTAGNKTAEFKQHLDGERSNNPGIN